MTHYSVRARASRLGCSSIRCLVLTLLVIMREVFKMKNYITLDHLEKMNKIIMATGLMVGYAYSWHVELELGVVCGVVGVHLQGALRDESESPPLEMGA